MSIKAILIFILFLGPLIFFHELGHFLFARLFGVRVETFSIGFGPKLLRFKRGDTEYVISLIPLGGYVKMFGDDPLKRDEIPEEERDVSYNFKNKWARFWIVMGGPLANFIMAFCIFSLLSMVGEKIPEMRLGKIQSTEKLYEYGFRTGDSLKKVNGKNIYNPGDILGDSEGIVRTITISRDGELRDLNVGIDGKEFFDLITMYPPYLLSPILIDKTGSAYLVSKRRVSSAEEFHLSIEQIAEKTEGQLFLYKVKELKEVPIKELKFDPEPIVFDLRYTPETFAQLVREKGFYQLDLGVQKVKLDSAAKKAGVLEGDILFKLNGDEVYSFTELRESLQETHSETVSVSLLRNGVEKTLEMQPLMMRDNDKVVKLIGVFSNARHMPLNFINTEQLGLFASFGAGVTRTYDAIGKTIDGFVKLITGAVSFKNIGGPVTIGRVAKDSFEISLSYFFQIMAMISVNLGVINLFPIPILDGGHIMFLLFEAINGGPLSRRKMEIAQMVGLSIILLLMSGALFNDFSRWF